MEKVMISFNELRRIKDSLPHGSMQRIADELQIAPDTVRNYFGATNFINGSVPPGVYFEQGGPDGGIVSFDDPTILNMAKEILEQEEAVKE